MKITERQRKLVSKLNQIVYRKKKSGRQAYFLGVEDCTAAINSLLVKGLVKASEDRRTLTWTGMIPLV